VNDEGRPVTTTITNTTVNPVVIPSGKPVSPFAAVAVNETSLPASEMLSITLTGGGSDLGSIADPMGGGTYDQASHTFTELSVATGTPTSASLILQRLVYTPPTLTAGNYSAVTATITDVGKGAFGGALPPIGPASVVLETVTPPAITGTVGGEPIASGATLHPFATTRVADFNMNYNAQDTATITLLDGAGHAADADGLLTGPGLGKTGVGTYALAGTSAYQLQSYLQRLVFAPAAVDPNMTRSTTFALHVGDVATGLPADDTATSVLAIGPALAAKPTPPFITGTVGGQTVAPGNAISPFNGVTISDANAAPQDSATLTVTGGGTLSGAGLVAAGPGVYTVAATSPTALTSILTKIAFTAPPLGAQSSITSAIKLDVVDGGQSASDSKTTITAAPPIPPPPATSGTFNVVDQTTGQQTFLGGDKYSGPVIGLDRQLILASPDNLNISSTAPNMFIHSGSGTDAINVSGANGNNILDGSTGSNFLVGGTGRDTFFLDDRGPTSDMYSTVVNFHSGDNVTIFGVDPVNFHVITQDNQGAVGAKGLTYTFTAPGKPNASVVIAGFSQADLANGRLSASYGSNPDLPGQPGSGNVFLNIHGN